MPNSQASVADFDILIPVYAGDDPQYFREAMNSILDNDLQPKKIVLVQDGPVPPELQAEISVVERNESVELLRCEQNVGLARALNLGLTRVTSPFVIRADSDDINLPTRFRRLMREFEKGFELVGSYIEEITPDTRSPIAVRAVPIDQDRIKETLPKRNPFNHMAVGFCARTARELGGYPQQRLREDYALWVKFSVNGAKMKNIPTCLVKARTGMGMYRRRGGIRYVVDEVHFQRFLLASGVTSYRMAFVNGLLRCFVFAMPAAVRGIVYKKFLRSS